MRDIAYEQALLRHQRRMLRILDECSQENTDTLTERDFLAIQRALQVYMNNVALSHYRLSIIRRQDLRLKEDWCLIY